jgi:hypothetical protein
MFIFLNSATANRRKRRNDHGPHKFVHDEEMLLQSAITDLSQLTPQIRKNDL